MEQQAGNEMEGAVPSVAFGHGPPAAGLRHAVPQLRKRQTRKERCHACAKYGDRLALLRGHRLECLCYCSSFMKANLSLPIRVAFILGLIFPVGRMLAAQAIPPTYATMKKVQMTIPMKDGVRLAVSLYMPEGAKPEDKFPAILEYLPYRKDDGTLCRDWDLHLYWVRRGYVTARV